MVKRHPKLEEIIILTIKIRNVKSEYYEFGPYYTAKTKNGDEITSALRETHLYESLGLKGYTKHEISLAKRKYQNNDCNQDLGPEYWSAWR